MLVYTKGDVEAEAGYMLEEHVPDDPPDDPPHRNVGWRPVLSPPERHCVSTRQTAIPT